MDVLWGCGGRLWHGIIVAPLKLIRRGSKTSNHEQHPSKVGKGAKSPAMMMQMKLDGVRFCDDLTQETMDVHNTAGLFLVLTSQCRYFFISCHRFSIGFRSGG